MDYTTLVAESKAGQEQSTKGMQSLYQVCREVVDGRKARGKRVRVGGLVGGAGASEAGRHAEPGGEKSTGSRISKSCCARSCSCRGNACPVPIPTAMRWRVWTVNRSMPPWRLGSCERRAESRCGKEPSCLAVQPSGRHVHLAVDGKALRGTGKQAYGGEDPQKQVLHVYETQTGVVLQQCPIAIEHNEVSTLKPFLTEALCKGRLITSDAAQSYHDFGRQVQRAGGDVVLFIKGNTPLTRADLELFFEDSEADRRTWQSFEQIEKGHGRLERRHITTSPDRNRLPAPRLGRGGTGLSFATRTHHQRQ